MSINKYVSRYSADEIDAAVGNSKEEFNFGPLIGIGYGDATSLFGSAQEFRNLALKIKEGKVIPVIYADDTVRKGHSRTKIYPTISIYSDSENNDYVGINLTFNGFNNDPSKGVKFDIQNINLSYPVMASEIILFHIIGSSNKRATRVVDNLNNDPELNTVDADARYALSAHQGTLINARLTAIEETSAVVIPDLSALSIDSTSDEIIAAFGGDESFTLFSDKAKKGKSVFLMKVNMDPASEDFSLHVITGLQYTQVSNTSYDIDFSISMGITMLGFKISNSDTSSNTLSLGISSSTLDRMLNLDGKADKAPSDGKLYGMRNGAWVEIPTA